MPEWLLKDEEYFPQLDRDTFINKSILSLLKVLSKIRAQNSYRSSKLSVNAALKVAFTFLLIVLLSVATNSIFVIIINVYVLLQLCLLKAEEIIKIFKASFVAVVFTFIILLPSILGGNVHNSIILTLKVCASVTAVNILSFTTQWSSITSAFKRFFVPDIFILVLDITIKYIVLLGEFSLNMLYSLKLRSVGKNNNKNASLSGIAGTMFIKSKEMAEDMYTAMECRGFTGEYRIYNKFKFTFIDFVYIIINMMMIPTFVYFGRI